MLKRCFKKEKVKEWASTVFLSIIYIHVYTPLLHRDRHHRNLLFHSDESAEIRKKRFQRVKPGKGWGPQQVQLDKSKSRNPCRKSFPPRMHLESSDAASRQWPEATGYGGRL